MLTARLWLAPTEFAAVALVAILPPYASPTLRPCEVDVPFATLDPLVLDQELVADEESVAEEEVPPLTPSEVPEVFVPPMPTTGTPPVTPELLLLPEFHPELSPTVVLLELVALPPPVEELEDPSV